MATSATAIMTIIPDKSRRACDEPVSAAKMATKAASAPTTIKDKIGLLCARRAEAIIATATTAW
jgi:hypothetical protein